MTRYVGGVAVVSDEGMDMLVQIADEKLDANPSNPLARSLADALDNLAQVRAQRDALCKALRELLDDRDAACVCDESEARCRYHASERAARDALPKGGR